MVNDSQEEFVEQNSIVCIVLSGPYKKKNINHMVKYNNFLAKVLCLSLSDPQKEKVIKWETNRSLTE